MYSEFVASGINRRKYPWTGTIQGRGTYSGFPLAYTGPYSSPYQAQTMGYGINTPYDPYAYAIHQGSGCPCSQGRNQV